MVQDFQATWTDQMLWQASPCYYISHLDRPYHIRALRSVLALWSKPQHILPHLMVNTTSTPSFLNSAENNGVYLPN